MKIALNSFDIDCLLVTPPEVGMTFPRGAAELASYLQANGITVRIEPLAWHCGACEDSTAGDAGPIRAALAGLIDQYRPAVIGVSNLFTVHFASCAQILALCKELSPEVLTVIGGPHVTFDDLATVKAGGIDVVVRGEGEETLLELVRCHLRGGDLATVRGLTVIDDAGKPVRTGDREPADLADMPPIDFSLLPAGFMRDCHVYCVMTRGCAFKCSFCVEHRFWRRRRDYPLERVIDELVRLHDQFGNTPIGVEDAMVYLGSPSFREFCDQVAVRRVPLHREFFVLSRIDTINGADLEAMSRAGISHVRIGVESGSPAVRRRMNKAITNEQIVSSLRSLQRAGLSSLAFWIIGHPGDSPEHSRESLIMLDQLFREQLISFAILSLFVPYPGTTFFDDPVSHGLRILTTDWRRWHRWGAPPVCELENFDTAAINAEYERALDILVKHGQHERQTPFEGEFSAFLRHWADCRRICPRSESR